MTTTSSSSIWKTLEHEPVLAAVEAQWRRWLHDAPSFETFRSFLRPEQSLALTYPCPTPCLPCCPRRVVEHGPDDFVAVCDAPVCGDVHDPIVVSRLDLVVWRLDLPTLARSVAKGLGTSGSSGTPVPHAPGAMTLGSIIGDDGTLRSVYLTIPSVRGVVSQLIAGSTGPVVIVVADRESIDERDAMLIASHGGRLVYCAETFTWHDGVGLVAAAQEPIHSRVIAQVITASGRSTLTREEHASLSASAEKLDFIIDLTTTTDAGRYFAGRTTPKGSFEAISLSWAQAASLVELIENGRALRPRELRSLVSINNPTKIVEQARRAIDTKLSRYTWRSIHTLRADDPAAKRFQFNPPPDLRYAVILPVEQERSQ